MQPPTAARRGSHAPARRGPIRRARSALAVTLTGMAASFSLCAPTSSAAAPDVLHVGQPLPRFDRLKAGERRYVRYKETGERRMILDTWVRTVSFEVRDGKRQLHITQQWDEATEKRLIVNQDAWFEAGTFRPITQVKRIDREGNIQLGGYRFLPDRIVGMAELAGNLRKDFSVPAAEPAYNFETDMELMQTLPLGPGYEASIVFYDPAPGAEPPKRYRFRVVGSEKAAPLNGPAVDCWVVTSEDEGPSPVRWWYAKDSQVLVREEGRLPDGALLVKALATADALAPPRSSPRARGNHSAHARPRAQV